MSTSTNESGAAGVPHTESAVPRRAPMGRLMQLAEAYASARVQDELAGQRDASPVILKRNYERVTAARKALADAIDDLESKAAGL